MNGFGGVRELQGKNLVTEDAGRIEFVFDVVLVRFADCRGVANRYSHNVCVVGLFPHHLVPVQPIDKPVVRGPNQAVLKEPRGRASESAKQHGLCLLRLGDCGVATVERHGPVAVAVLVGVTVDVHVRHRKAQVCGIARHQGDPRTVEGVPSLELVQAYFFSQGIGGQHQFHTGPVQHRNAFHHRRFRRVGVFKRDLHEVGRRFLELAAFRQHAVLHKCRQRRAFMHHGLKRTYQSVDARPGATIFTELRDVFRHAPGHAQRMDPCELGAVGAGDLVCR